MRAVDWGVDVIERLLPHRPPFRLLDRIDAIALGEAPALRASRAIDPADPVFAGHFPGAPIYPGVLVIETMAQAAGALGVCIALGEEGLARVDEAEAAESRLLGSVNVRLLAPVLPGARLTVEARLVRTVGDARQVAVRAWVGREEVAVGTVSAVGRAR